MLSSVFLNASRIQWVSKNEEGLTCLDLGEALPASQRTHAFLHGPRAHAWLAGNARTICWVPSLALWLFGTQQPGHGEWWLPGLTHSVHPSLASCSLQTRLQWILGPVPGQTRSFRGTALQWSRPGLSSPLIFNFHSPPYFSFRTYVLRRLS